jgi:hypothetical protein
MQLPIGNLLDLKQCEYHAVFKIDVTDFVVACFPDDQCGEQKVALSALGENLLQKVVKKVDNAKITSNATI